MKNKIMMNKTTAFILITAATLALNYKYSRLAQHSIDSNLNNEKALVNYTTSPKESDIIQMPVIEPASPVRQKLYIGSAEAESVRPQIYLVSNAAEKVSYSTESKKFIIPHMDDMYCQPTPEELRKRNCSFKLPHTRSLVMDGIDIIAEWDGAEKPSVLSTRNRIAENNTERAYTKRQNEALKHQNVIISNYKRF